MEFVFGLATGLMLALICLFSLLLIRRRRLVPATGRGPGRGPSGPAAGDRYPRRTPPIAGAGTAAVPLPQDVEDDDDVEYHSVGRSPLVGARPGGYRAVEALLRPGELA